MLKFSTSNQFEKDLKKAKKQHKHIELLFEIIHKLLNEKELDQRYRNHRLKGEYNGHHECHLEPDWLLIYKKMDDEIRCERLGSHSELFR